ncbi:hypothetical protein CCUS01_08619 [Colletotrichum cuscutae]|uniref:Uncharacterized protein n=1 Tax=Colletotrichum cuscutae TaxID=1209917 RepID=A0AAI9UPQ5_9PEZI|nr:hypothetical protein CCUS01_08619 [Colletotrichum cuscutae]
MHLSPFFQLIVAALITPGMALPTEVKETGQAATSHAPPTAMADSISAKEFDGTMTTVSTSTRCIHASLRPLCPALCGITSIAGDDVYWECVRGCDCRSKKHGGYYRQSSDKTKDSDDTLGTNSTISSSRQNICHK